MIIVFDVDGVLVDTRELVRRAYAEVGVIQPDYAWHQPWYNWLPGLAGGYALAKEVHTNKNIAYINLISVLGVPELPAATLVKSWPILTNVLAMSSGSEFAVYAVLRAVGLHKMQVLGTGLSEEAKNDVLCQVVEPGVYIDDSEFEPAAPGWRTVRYTAQTAEELEKEILWTR